MVVVIEMLSANPVPDTSSVFAVPPPPSTLTPALTKGCPDGLAKPLTTNASSPVPPLSVTAARLRRTVNESPSSPPLIVVW